MNKTLKGSNEDSPNQKVFNEAFEIRVRNFLSPHIDEENRVNGNLAWVVKDYDKLLIGLMEFIKNEQSKKKIK